jgi:hypothetical protein
MRRGGRGRREWEWCSYPREEEKADCEYDEGE